MRDRARGHRVLRNVWTDHQRQFTEGLSIWLASCCSRWAAAKSALSRQSNAEACVHLRPSLARRSENPVPFWRLLISPGLAWQTGRGTSRAVIPLKPKDGLTPISCHAALDRSACAPFIKERRMSVSTPQASAGNRGNGAPQRLLPVWQKLWWASPVLLDTDSAEPATQCFAAGGFAPAGFAPVGFAAVGAVTPLPGPPTGSSIGSLCSTDGNGGKGAWGSVWYQ